MHRILSISLAALLLAILAFAALETWVELNAHQLDAGWTLVGGHPD
jgi:hypothetical protein